MACLMFTGFESGSIDELASPGGTFSIQTSVARSGTYAMQINPATVDVGAFHLMKLSGGIMNANLNSTDTYIRFYFRVDTAPSSGREEVMLCSDSTGATSLYLFLNSARKLDVYDSTNTLKSSGTTVLSLATWYRLEVHAHNGAAGAYELKINGVSEYSSTCNQGGNAMASVYFGKVDNTSSQTINFYYDDILIDDAAFPGAGQCAVLIPAANGTYQSCNIGAGSGSHYQIVQGIPPVGDTSYLVTTTSTTQETETVQTRAQAVISVGTVNSVKPWNEIRQNGASAGSVKLRLRSNTTDSDSAGRASSGTYKSTMGIFNTDPATTAAWLPVGLDTLQVGIMNNSANASRMTSALIFVDFVPTVATGSVFFPASDLNGLGTGGKFFSNPLG